MKLPRANIKRGRVEIIPMIDTILILLIFYMSFSTFTVKEQPMDAKLPVVTTKGATGAKHPLDVSLHILDRQRIVVNGNKTVDSTELRGDMELISQAGGPEVTVVVSADPEADYQAIIAALDACALAKLKKVAFQPLAQPRQP
jgi:biopolymer transport protein ExbD